MIAWLSYVLNLPITERVVMALILVNAVTLGLETSPAIMADWGTTLQLIDRVLLGIFALELLARIAVHRWAFFKDAWNVFDFVVVAIAFLPATGTLSVLRALRILRVLRLITVVPSLKRVVGALVGALPGMGSIALLLVLFLYVSAVAATKLFQSAHPELFGDMGRSTYTLVQLMTLDGWSAEIVGPVMKTHPYSWLFFLPFVLATAFTVLNLFIGIVVSAMQAEHDKVRDTQHEEELRSAAQEQAVLLAELRALKAEVMELRASLNQR